MKYKLMHKNVETAILEIENQRGSVQKVCEVISPEHMPVGVRVSDGKSTRDAVDQWWSDRSVPMSRFGIRGALDILNIESPKALLIRSYGLSLSDQYWVLPEGAYLRWEEINFFDNSFSDDIGDALFGKQKEDGCFSFNSPDGASNGDLIKRWKIVNGKRCLLKGGSGPFMQQPFNEVIASRIAKLLCAPCVTYEIYRNDGKPYSICENFVTRNTELVPAWRVLLIEKKSNSTSMYQHFVNCCNALGIPDVKPVLDRMLTLDFVIANEDRHFNNFGLIRDADTLEWLGMAPIYDSGNSLGYMKLTRQIRMGYEPECKPFRTTHAKQLKLVSSFDWLDFDKLSVVPEIIKDVFLDRSAEETIDEQRIGAISHDTSRRARMLNAFVREQKNISCSLG